MTNPDDLNCPTCHHPATQHLLIGSDTHGIAVCKICGAHQPDPERGIARCDFRAVRAAVERVHPGSTKMLGR